MNMKLYTKLLVKKNTNSLDSKKLLSNNNLVQCMAQKRSLL